MKRADPYDFCDDFNDLSCDYEDTVPLNTLVVISNTKFFIDIKSPTSFILFNILFNMDVLETEKFKGNRLDTFITVNNLSLIFFQPDIDFFYSDLAGAIKNVYSSYDSYNAGKKHIVIPKKIRPFASRRHLYNFYTSIIEHKIRKRDLHRLQKGMHYFEDHEVEGYYASKEFARFFARSQKVIN